jgi:hypothetical protein
MPSNSLFQGPQPSSSDFFSLPSNQFSLIDKFYFNKFHTNPNSKPASSHQTIQPKLSSYLYSFDLNRLEWRMLVKSPVKSYMHSMLLFNDTLLFYGGISVKDHQDFLNASPQISNELSLFDIDNNVWQTKHELILNEQSQIIKIGKFQNVYKSSESTRREFL